jgi:hypothetical protein
MENAPKVVNQFEQMMLRIRDKHYTKKENARRAISKCGHLSANERQELLLYVEEVYANVVFIESEGLSMRNQGVETMVAFLTAFGLFVRAESTTVKDLFALFDKASKA